MTKALDIYKWMAPHIDVVAPDNYPDDSRGYEYNAINYSREDNPYFTPESAGDQNMFRGIAEYNLIGNFFFGVKYIVDENCQVRPEYQALIENFRCVSSAIPLLLKYQGTGKVHAIIQEFKQAGNHRHGRLDGTSNGASARHARWARKTGGMTLDMSGKSKRN